MHKNLNTPKALAFAGGLALTAGLLVWTAPLASAAAPTAPATAEAPKADAPKDGQNMRERFRARMEARMEERMQDRRGGAERRPEIDRKLTTDQVRDIVEGRLAMAGNANVKVGKVTAKEEGVVAVDIVTKTGALVETREISTRTGRSVAAERARGDRGPRFGRGAGGGGPERGGPGRGGPERDLKLTTDQVRKLAEARLIMRANPNLKVGAVKEKDADTITVDIVAADNSLVVQQEINRHTGRPNRGRS